MRMMAHVDAVYRDKFLEKKRQCKKVFTAVITRYDQGRPVPKNDIFAAFQRCELIPFDIELDEACRKVR